jgi:hypothetical protein
MLARLPLKPPPPNQSLPLVVPNSSLPPSQSPAHPPVQLLPPSPIHPPSPISPPCPISPPIPAATQSSPRFLPSMSKSPAYASKSPWLSNSQLPLRSRLPPSLKSSNPLSSRLSSTRRFIPPDPAPTQLHFIPSDDATTDSLPTPLLPLLRPSRKRQRRQTLHASMPHES